MPSPWLGFTAAPPREDERALLECGHRYPRYRSLAELTEETLRQLAAAEGLEFATALLYDRIRHGPEHGPTLDRLLALPDEIPSPPTNRNLTIAIVPGAFYARRPDTGADGQFLMDELLPLGYRVERIPLHSFGPLGSNARIIRDWLAARPEQPVILVSLSKGGAEVKLALSQPGADADFGSVIAWINLSGMLSGTPLVGQLLDSKLRTLWVRLLFWYQNYDFTVLRELERGPQGLLAGDLQLPAHLQAFHLVGFPLKAHLTRRLARRNYGRLARLGPNESGILLADVCRWPGWVVPIWGADHFLRPACDFRRILGRLLHYLRQVRGMSGNRTERVEILGVRP